MVLFRKSDCFESQWIQKESEWIQISRPVEFLELVSSYFWSDACCWAHWLNHIELIVYCLCRVSPVSNRFLLRVCLKFAFDTRSSWVLQKGSDSIQLFIVFNSTCHDIEDIDQWFPIFFLWSHFDITDFWWLPQTFQESVFDHDCYTVLKIQRSWRWACIEINIFFLSITWHFRQFSGLRPQGWKTLS